MTASLPPGQQQFFSATGTPLALGTVDFYVPSTTTRKDTWQDAAGATLNSNPVLLDVAGRALILGAGSYRQVVKDAAGNTIWDQVVSAPLSESAAASSTGAALIGYGAGTIKAALDTLNAAPTKNFSISGSFVLNSISTPASGSYFGAGGNALSFNTLISNPSGGADSDNQRATALFKAATQDDGNSEEQTVCVLTTIATGYRTTWAGSTAYALNANVTNGTNVYRCTTAGTSAASGGPTGKGSGIVDGTAVWLWINDGATDAKVGIYNETLLSPGAGSSWSQANNLQIASGVISSFIVNTEFDLTNNCGIDSVFAGKNKYGLYVQCNGANVSTSAIDVGTSNSANFAALWGAHFTGAKLASNSVIGIDASSAVGIGIGTAFGGAATPTFTTAAIGDGSTSPYGMKLAGTYAKTPASSSLLPNFANDAAAATGGLAVGDWYRNGSVLMQRVA